MRSIILSLIGFFLFSMVIAKGEITNLRTAKSENSHDSLELTKNNNETACDVIRDDIPEECTCHDSNRWSFVVRCMKSFNETYFTDDVGMEIAVDPCDPLGSKLDVEIVDDKYNIDYRIAGVRTGEEKDVPIPGASIVVPHVGHMGLDVAVYVGGNLDQLTLKVGLNACTALRHKNICASDIPHLNRHFPWWAIKDTFSFGHLCNNTTAIM